jgi:hypothetical protein
MKARVTEKETANVIRARIKGGGSIAARHRASARVIESASA